MDYDTWLKDSPLEFKKKLIEKFIENTISYSKEHLSTRISELPGAKTSDYENKIGRIAKWIAYIEFQKHTLEEIKGDKIDSMIP